MQPEVFQFGNRKIVSETFHFYLVRIYLKNCFKLRISELSEAIVSVVIHVSQFDVYSTNFKYFVVIQDNTYLEIHLKRAILNVEIGSI